MPELNLTLLAAVPTLIAILFLILYLKEYSASHKDPGHISNKLIEDATKKAEIILANAELAAVKIANSSKFRTGELEDKYTQAVEQAHKEYKIYLDSLSRQVDQSVVNTQELIKEHTNRLFEQFEENLSQYLIQTQAQSTRAIELEMQAARQLINTYKSSQLKLIDENIVAIMERTLSLVMNKKTSLKEQVDLVYESLEKAKAEKFLI